ncbi:D-alanyl-D-alanine carboxypeptidase [Candidatus Uhrbacteria bacterium]|nr:D-alanyl-D-alanine carboxypeptidase [Candidatus Uhrbacteria bacterium]
MLGSLLGSLIALTLASPGQIPSGITLNTLPQANDVVKPQPPVKRRTDSLGIKTLAPSAFVADVATGNVLFAKDAHRVMPIASLTKLMTAMVLLDSGVDLKQTVVMKDQDFDRESKGVFKVGEELTYGDLLKTMLVGSINASASAIARASMGTDKFIAAMNAKAVEMGLKSPHYEDPSGLDPDNRASAADIAAIITKASSYPEIRDVSHLSEVTVRGLRTGQAYTVKSTNLLLGSFINRKPYSVVTAKTGSLPEAGYNMAQVTRNLDGHEIVAVELGNDNHFGRFQDIKSLTYWAFDTYEWR